MCFYISNAVLRPPSLFFCTPSSFAVYSLLRPPSSVLRPPSSGSAGALRGVGDYSRSKGASSNPMVDQPRSTGIDLNISTLHSHNNSPAENLALSSNNYISAQRCSNNASPYIVLTQSPIAITDSPNALAL